MSARVAVVGAGMAGAACARALTGAGIAVEVLERGRAPGGRLASPDLHGRRVDLGAAYLTVKDDAFRAVVDDWRARGLVRPWTEVFEAIGPDGRTAKPGPLRYGTPGGLRSLARNLLSGLDVRTGAPVEDLAALDHDAVVLAMPDPQARRLAPHAADWVDYEPVVAVAAGWERRAWQLADAAFVNGDDDITLVADDGARRGDGAPVLVVHSTAAHAARHRDDPDAAVPAMVSAARRALDIAAQPAWTHAHRWTFAKPTGTHGDAPFGLTEHAGRPLGLCTDAWCPSGAPRVESAWLSGTALGTHLARRLA